jgi:hypothetical protein
MDKATLNQAMQLLAYCAQRERTLDLEGLQKLFASGLLTDVLDFVPMLVGEPRSRAGWDQIKQIRKALAEAAYYEIDVGGPEVNISDALNLGAQDGGIGVGLLLPDWTSSNHDRLWNKYRQEACRVMIGGGSHHRVQIKVSHSGPNFREEEVGSFLSGKGLRVPTLEESIRFAVEYREPVKVSDGEPILFPCEEWFRDEKLGFSRLFVSWSGGKVCFIHTDQNIGSNDGLLVAGVVI